MTFEGFDEAVVRHHRGPSVLGFRGRASDKSEERRFGIAVQHVYQCGGHLALRKPRRWRWNDFGQEFSDEVGFSSGATVFTRRN